MKLHRRGATESKRTDHSQEEFNEQMERRVKRLEEIARFWKAQIQMKEPRTNPNPSEIGEVGQ